MTKNIKNILAKLDLPDTGKYDDHAYVIPLADSNEYARMYTLLNKNATNKEYPDIDSNTNASTVKITNYFETDENNETYSILLVADFDEDTYYISISTKQDTEED